MDGKTFRFGSVEVVLIHWMEGTEAMRLEDGRFQVGPALFARLRASGDPMSDWSRVSVYDVPEHQRPGYTPPGEPRRRVVQ